MSRQCRDYTALWAPNVRPNRARKSLSGNELAISSGPYMPLPRRPLWGILTRLVASRYCKPVRQIEGIGQNDGISLLRRSCVYCSEMCIQCRMWHGSDWRDRPSGPFHPTKPAVCQPVIPCPDGGTTEARRVSTDGRRLAPFGLRPLADPTPKSKPRTQPDTSPFPLIFRKTSSGIFLWPRKFASKVLATLTFRCISVNFHA